MTHTNQQGDFSGKMCDNHKAWLEKAEKEGKNTAEQAREWQEHFTYMKEFHSKNGMGMMDDGMMGKGMMSDGMMEGCGGAAKGSGAEGMMKGQPPCGMMNGAGPGSSSAKN